MTWFNTLAILLVTYLVLFFQATFNDVRHLVGVQVDLLPSLVVYTALSSGLITLSLVAVCGGLWMDSLSVNPLGVTMLPLFVVGLLIHRSREFILRDQPYAQMMLGLSASAAVPAVTLVILFNLGAHPLIGWFSLWQWIVVSAVGACATPVWFALFDWIERVLTYRPVAEGGYRPDREIKEDDNEDVESRESRVEGRKWHSAALLSTLDPRPSTHSMIIFDQLKKNDPHLRAVTWGVLVGMGILFVGLWWVQIISYRHFSENQKAQSYRTVRIPAIRGKILDRNGIAVAENKPSHNVILYLDELREEFRREWARTRPPRNTRLTVSRRRALEGQARYRVASNSVSRIAAALREPVTLSFDDFMRHYTNQLALPLTVLANLDTASVCRLLEGSSNPRGIDLEIQPVRHYPGNNTAAHILGYLLRDNSSYEGELADFSFRLPDYRGRVGIEGSFDADLRGKAGAKSVLVNSLGFRQSENIWTPAEPGKNVVLTIDLGLQRAAENALRTNLLDVRGAVVVLDCNNGDILAMASSPAFDPNIFIPFINQTNYDRLTNATLRPQINRATQENYRPGSIFKIVTGLACLEAGLDPEETIRCDGEIWIGRRRINDLAPAGDYNFRRAFIKSSNAYFITNGLKYGIENVVRLGREFHLGEKTGLLTGQEVGGSFPDLKMIRRGWAPGDSANLCIGQGALDTTPMQIALMVAAVANGGKVLWPRLVDRIEPADPLSDEQVIDFPSKPPRNRLTVKPQNLALMREAMVADVEDPEGTGFKAFHESDLKTPKLKDFRVGGKTGTAEVERLGKNLDKTTWFASYGPFENPRYVVVAMVENVGSGGGTCAPITVEVYKKILEVEAKPGALVARRD